MKCAEHYQTLYPQISRQKQTPCCIGIEIDEKRYLEACENIRETKVAHLCQMINMNALEVDYSQATAFFCYLIPRGKMTQINL